VQPYFNLFHGQPENIGNLLAAKIHEVSEKDDASLRLWKKAEFILDTLGHFSLL